MITKRILLIAAATAAFVSSAFADVTIFYPNQDDAVFTVTAPESDWEFAPSKGEDEDGGYCTLSSEGTVLYFRTVEATEDSLNEAIEATFKYVGEEYPGVAVPDVKEQKIDGHDALTCHAEGKDKDGDEYVFGFAWIFVDEKHVAEIWYESPKGDDATQAAAVKILESFKIAKGE